MEMEKTGHAPIYAEVKKIKLLALRLFMTIAAKLRVTSVALYFAEDATSTSLGGALLK